MGPFWQTHHIELYNIPIQGLFLNFFVLLLLIGLIVHTENLGIGKWIWLDTETWQISYHNPTSEKKT